MKVKCGHCGNELDRKPSLVKKSKTGLFFCDRICKQAEQRIGGKLELEHYGKKNYCLNCGKECKKKYCSTTCQQSYLRKIAVDKWLSGKWDGLRSKNSLPTLSKYIRNYLLDIAQNTCEICGTKEWMGKQVPLEIDHVDGDHRNNRPENLRVICLNCHGQTSTYRAKNTGRGGRPYLRTKNKAHKH